MNFKELLEKELDRLYPKGDKERGKALILFAYAVLLQKRRLEEVEKTKFERGKRKWCIECVNRIKKVF